LHNFSLSPETPQNKVKNYSLALFKLPEPLHFEVNTDGDTLKNVILESSATARANYDNSNYLVHCAGLFEQYRRHFVPWFSRFRVGRATTRLSRVFGFLERVQNRL
jgi:hypothetical protein